MIAVAAGQTRTLMTKMMLRWFFVAASTTLQMEVVDVVSYLSHIENIP